MKHLVLVFSALLLLTGCKSESKSDKANDKEIKYVISIEEVATDDRQIFSYNNVWVDTELRKQGGFRMRVEEVDASSSSPQRTISF